MQFALGGTSLLIIISTGIEGMKQLSYLLAHKYVGFMDTTARIEMVDPRSAFYFNF